MSHFRLSVRAKDEKTLNEEWEKAIKQVREGEVKEMNENNFNPDKLSPEVACYYERLVQEEFAKGKKQFEELFEDANKQLREKIMLIEIEHLKHEREYWRNNYINLLKEVSSIKMVGEQIEEGNNE